jgi:ParB-like chromosome segregation protein Spo0J
MRMQSIELKRLVRDPENPRSHDDRNMGAIRASLEAHGQVEPLVVQRSSRMVIAGNGRVAAMLELGWDAAQCVMLDVDDTTARKLSITLNRSGELAGWDEAVLAQHLSALEELEGDAFDVEALGFDTSELEALVGAYINATEELAEMENDPLPPGTQPTDMPSANLRVVQLYLDPDAEPGFQLQVRSLAESFGTDNVTATVCEAVRRMAEDLGGQ